MLEDGNTLILKSSIRHRNDWGAIILLDSRYKNKSVTNNLSKWLRDRVKSFPKLSDGCNSLKAFIEHNTARDKAQTVDPESFKNEIIKTETLLDQTRGAEFNIHAKDEQENEFIIVQTHKTESTLKKEDLEDKAQISYKQESY